MPTESSRRSKILAEPNEDVVQIMDPELLVEKKKTKKKSRKQVAATSDTEPDHLANTIVNDAVEERASLEPGLLVEMDKKKKKKKSKKRAAATSDIELDLADSTVNDTVTVHLEAMDGVLVDDDINEPTIGEKLAVLNFDASENKIDEKQGPLAPGKPPSADSVSVLLKQALHADDRTLLLDCLYTQDEKVIANSTLALNPSDVSKLLDALIYLIQSRGAVLVCALPWLRLLLLQHASGIISQESSLLALNSLYQLIDSRVATFGSALQLSSSLDFFYSGVLDEGQDENDAIMPVIFEDNDESDEEESEDGMDTDEDDEIALGSDGDVSDIEGIESMLD